MGGAAPGMRRIALRSASTPKPPPVRAPLTQHAAGSVLSRIPEDGALQRAPSKASIDRAAGQVADSGERVAWLKLIQALISGLGIKGLVPPSLEFTVGLDSLGTPIQAHLVPGEIDDVALVVAGVHGSEQSGVEVADRLLAQLQVHRPFFTVVIVPRLFPDNVASRAAWEKKLAADQGKIAVSKYREIRTKDKDPGRVTPGKGAKDPNRQFPALGADLDPVRPLDSKGDPVEPGNIALMAVIKQFAPKRLISIHAQKDLNKAGIFADPHPSAAPGPLAVAADDLAIAAAKRADALGVRVAGNTRDGGFSSLYPGQNPKISAEKMREENAKGQSLGQWGPSKGIMVLTVEVSEQYTSTGAANDPKRGTELEGEATALREVVLGPPPGTLPAGGAAAPATGTGAPAAPPAPVQRLVMSCIAAEAGNLAATHAVQRLQSPSNRTALPRTESRQRDQPLQRAPKSSTFGADVLLGGATAIANGTSKAASALSGGLRDLLLGLPAERTLLKRLVISGVTDPGALTSAVFAFRHPETIGRTLNPKVKADKALLREKVIIRREVVLPAIERYQPETVLTATELDKKIRRATKQATSGGEESARRQMATDIKKITGADEAAWFAHHVPNARFLGVPIRPSSGSAVGGVHQELLTKLDTAADILAAHPTLTGRQGIEIADEIGMHSIGGLRPPKAATGKERPSLHCYGLAVDINYPTNPFVGLNGDAVPKMVARATLLMHGKAFRIERPPPESRTVMEQWEQTQLASADVVAYLNLDQVGLEAQVNAMLTINPTVQAAQRKVAWWTTQQANDRALKGKGDLTGRDPRKTGIMELDHRLVEALDRAGLTWGGMYNHAKDLMHFDDRSMFRTGGT
ncbi:MAG TPA: M15 family metallopeptidase [Microlunatus sp.]